MLRVRLPGAGGYLGYEDKMAYFTRKWTSDILLRNYDAVCKTSAVLLLTGGV